MVSGTGNAGPRYISASDRGLFRLPGSGPLPAAAGCIAGWGMSLDGWVSPPTVWPPVAGRPPEADGFGRSGGLGRAAQHQPVLGQGLVDGVPVELGHGRRRPPRRQDAQGERVLPAPALLGPLPGEGPVGGRPSPSGWRRCRRPFPRAKRPARCASNSICTATPSAGRSARKPDSYTHSSPSCRLGRSTRSPKPAGPGRTNRWVPSRKLSIA